MQQSLIWHQHHVINCRQLCRLTVQADDKGGLLIGYSLGGPHQDYAIGGYTGSMETVLYNTLSPNHMCTKVIVILFAL